MLMNAILEVPIKEYKEAQKEEAKANACITVIENTQ